MKIIPSLAFFALLGTSAHAAITYVDATDGSGGNTRESGQLQSSTTWVGPDSTSANQDQWNKRVFGNGGTIYQARHEAAPTNTMPELTTRITGLANNTYDVWVFFWDATGTNVWNISAGLTSGALTTYSFDGLGITDPSTVIDAGGLGFTATVLTTEGSNRTLYGVNLGQATVSGGSDIDVFVDNLDGGGSNNRTWYDGVGYELVPEPSTALLGGLGLLMVLRRRRQ